MAHFTTLRAKRARFARNVEKSMDLNGKGINGRTSFMNAYINGQNNVVNRIESNETFFRNFRC